MNSGLSQAQLPVFPDKPLRSNRRDAWNSPSRDAIDARWDIGGREVDQRGLYRPGFSGRRVCGGGAAASYMSFNNLGSGLVAEVERCRRGRVAGQRRAATVAAITISAGAIRIQTGLWHSGRSTTR